jgi:3-hydroxyisobutyrate dehydrogenase-like beta-hydroxyacid dehydrogenase
VTGYSGTPLLTKLGVRDHHVVLLDRTPAGFALPSTGARVVTRLPASCDVVLTFHTHQASLRTRFPQVAARTATAGMVWVCWPKKAARKAHGIDADLDEDGVRGLGLAAGWVDVKVCAVDEVWSGLKLVRRLADR